MSLADNIQETFGLAPIEAMAAGLPLVVTDWDGYREAVRHEIDGFLIPTTQSPPGFGEQLAYQHLAGLDSYDNYIGTAAANVVVDMEATNAAILALVSNPDLRRRMGDAGRLRARETFAWERVYGLYRDLWGELAERRAAAEVPPRITGRSINPQHHDPFRLFAHYATFTFGADSRVSATGPETLEHWQRALATPLLSLARPGIVGPEDLARLHAAIADVTSGAATGGGHGVAKLLDAVPRGHRDAALRTLTVLAKAGLVTIDGRIPVPDRPPPL